MIPSHELIQVLYLGKYVYPLASGLGKSVGNLEDVYVFLSEVAKGQSYCLKSYLGTSRIPTVVKGPTLGN